MLPTPHMVSQYTLHSLLLLHHRPGHQTPPHALPPVSPISPAVRLLSPPPPAQQHHRPQVPAPVPDEGDGGGPLGRQV